MAAEPQNSSQAEALKTTTLIGGSTAVSLVIRMVRTKALALFLGPTGIGLEAIYDSIVTLTKTLFDFGVSSSGVRQIAVAIGKNDQRTITATITTLRRVCLLFGVLGAAALFLARGWIGRISFGDTTHAHDIGILASILLLGSISGGQAALLQGTRQIVALARMNIIAAVVGAVVSVALVYIWGKNGIAPYMIVAAAASLATSWWYSRRVKVTHFPTSVRESMIEAKSLLALGLVFMTSGLMATGALFLLRIMVTKGLGLAASGQFQAANAISMVYVNFILQAMGADFYPRLAAAAHDHALCNRLVNEQAEISLLLALPGVVGTIVAAPWVMLVLYSGKFSAAAAILIWQVAGMYLRVNSWPMGFIILAKGRALTLFLTDLAAYSLYVVLGWIGLRAIGLPGLGLAFVGLYLFHWALIYRVVRRLSGFTWTTGTRRISVQGACAVAAALAARVLLPEPWATGVGAFAALATVIFSTSRLVRVIGRQRVVETVSRWSRSLRPKKRNIAPLPQPL
jgi:PST family polysaccharide transporter